MTKLSNQTIALLNFSRATAAVYIVFHHVGLSRGWTDGPGVFLRFGAEAVMVFFLLSGFVIFANEKDRATDLKGYALRRILRIYPCLVMAMAVSVIVAACNGTFREDFHLSELIGTLFALQDISTTKPGVIVDPFMGNAPLWSLSYEIAFYAFFPLFMVFWKRNPSATTHAVGAAAVIAYAVFGFYPNHWCLIIAYFLIWWTGAMAANAYLEGHRNILALKSVMTWMLLLILVATAVALKDGYHGVGLHPYFELRHFCVACTLVVVFFGPPGKWVGRLSDRVRSAATAVASISYGLYVFHLPLLVKAKWAASFPGLLGMAVILIGAAFVGDRMLKRILSNAERRKALPSTARPSTSGIPVAVPYAQSGAGERR